MRADCRERLAEIVKDAREQAAFNSSLGRKLGEKKKWDPSFADASDYCIIFVLPGTVTWLETFEIDDS